MPPIHSELASARRAAPMAAEDGPLPNAIGGRGLETGRSTFGVLGGGAHTLGMLQASDPYAAAYAEYETADLWASGILRFGEERETGRTGYAGVRY